MALGWVLAGYLPHFRDESRRRQLKLGPRPKRLGAAADAWIEKQRKASVPINTWQNARSALRHLRDHLGDEYRTDGLTTPVLQSLFDELVAERYAPNTLAAIRQGISNFLDHLAGGDAVGKYTPAEARKRRRRRPNATWGIELPPVVHEEVLPWTTEQLEALRGAADACDRECDDFHHYRLAVELGLASGARRNELFALPWSQLNAESRTVRITHQVHKQRRERVPLKSKRARTALFLPGWWEHHRVGETALVLPAPDGGLVHPRFFAKIRLRILEKAELYRPGLGFHIDRHTYAYDFVVLGGRFEELQKSLGHASITTTESLYGHFHEDVAASLARRRIYKEEPIKLVR